MALRRLCRRSVAFYHPRSSTCSALVSSQRFSSDVSASIHHATLSPFEIAAFIEPLRRVASDSELRASVTASKRSLVDEAVSYQCPFCFREALRGSAAQRSSTSSPETRTLECELRRAVLDGLPTRLGVELSRHFLFAHQLAGHSAKDFTDYNDTVLTARILPHTRTTDVLLILDLANVELIFSLADAENLLLQRNVVALFKTYRVTCVATHELMIPLGTSVIPAVFSKLLSQNPNSAFFTLFAADGLDSGDLTTAGAIQRVLRDPAFSSPIVVLSRDWSQRQSLQHVFDASAVQVVSLPKNAYAWASVLEDAFSSAVQ